jgi:succinate-acetate transporter protein
LGHSHPRVYGKSLDESITYSNTIQNGKAFEFTVFACFGAYYFSYAATMTPAFSVNSGYTTTNEFQNAIALLFLAWFFLFLLFTIAGIKTNLVLLTIFISVTLTAAFVSASHFMTAIGEDSTALNLQKVLLILYELILRFLTILILGSRRFPHAWIVGWMV